MPRAFLITHRRYNGAEEMFEETGRDYSPERGVRLAEYGGGHPTSDGASECGSETSSECPEELYNLTKLAEVSLAAAAGTLIHPSNVIYEQRPTSPRCAQLSEKSPRVLPPRSKPHQTFGPSGQPHQQLQVLSGYDEERQRGERTRLFFERIESERKILEKRSSGTVLEVRLPSPHRHRYHHRPEENQLRVPTDGSFVNEARFEANSASSNSSTSSSSSLSGSTGQPAKRSNSTENSKSEDSEDHECPDCGKKYSTSSNLARHRQTHRSLGDKKARRCPHCDKVYVSMPAFSMHVRTHNQGCKCHYCGKCFSRPWLLQGHIRTHTGEKPFKCTICNKAFADKSNLRAHIQTHSNTKPHVCGRCGKAFALKSYLYKHEESSCMRAHHRSSTEKSSDASSNESKSSSASSTPSPTTTSPPSLNRVQAPCVTASPTSVIVPRLDLNRDQRTSNSAFSAIIRHTRTSETNSTSAQSTSPSKRPCREKTSTEERKSPDPDYVSSMVIRTSVISPNPEHLGRFSGDTKKTSNYEFSESRTSAFGGPTTMTLNLAIA